MAGLKAVYRLLDWRAARPRRPDLTEATFRGRKTAFAVVCGWLLLVLSPLPSARPFGRSARDQGPSTSRGALDHPELDPATPQRAAADDHQEAMTCEEVP